VFNNDTIRVREDTIELRKTEKFWKLPYHIDPLFEYGIKYKNRIFFNYINMKGAGDSIVFKRFYPFDLNTIIFRWGIFRWYNHYFPLYKGINSTKRCENSHDRNELRTKKFFRDYEKKLKKR